MNLKKISLVSISLYLNLIELNRERGSLFTEKLELLKDKTLAIDADILLRNIATNPKKSLQEGHAALDMAV